MPLDKATLDKWRELADKATEGEWYFDSAWYIKAKGIGLLPDTEEDCEFICAARTAVPALLDEVERLREALEFYADDAHWTIEWTEGSNGDYGERARRALGKETGDE